MTRRTNIALAVVLGAATVTGVLSLLVGEGRVAVVVWAHGAAGLALLALVRPKSRIAVRGTARRGRAAAPGLLLGGLVAASMALGIAHATGVGTLGPLTALGWHIGLALAAVPVAAAHVWRRPPRPRTGDLTRADFLRAVGIAAAGVAAKLAFERLAGAPRAATGSLPRAAPVPTAWLDDTTPSEIATPFTAERLAALPADRGRVHARLHVRVVQPKPLVGRRADGAPGTSAGGDTEHRRAVGNRLLAPVRRL